LAASFETGNFALKLLLGAL